MTESAEMALASTNLWSSSMAQMLESGLDLSKNRKKTSRYCSVDRSRKRVNTDNPLRTRGSPIPGIHFSRALTTNSVDCGTWCRVNSAKYGRSASVKRRVLLDMMRKPDLKIMISRFVFEKEFWCTKLVSVTVIEIRHRNHYLFWK